MRIDDLIEQLEKLRGDVGGHVHVAVIASPGYVRDVEGATTAAVGKADPYKLVSRGGMPIIIIQA